MKTIYRSDSSFQICREHGLGFYRTKYRKECVRCKKVSSRELGSLLNFEGAKVVSCQGAVTQLVV